MTEPTLRTRATRTDDTRAALLAAAHDLLATEGPSALTVRRIATTAGMSTMNVYSRFGGKDGVLDELFIDGFRRLGAEVDVEPSADDPLEDLRHCGQAYRRFARRNPTYYSLMFDRAVPDFVPSDRAEQAALDALSRVVERVQRAMDAGLIEPGDPFPVAAALWACGHGLASLEARTKPETGEHFDWEQIGHIATDALVRGLSRRP
jgi:AcrR family transcriptional regulator